MKAGEKLIHRPHSQPRLQRTLFGLFTFVAWSLYLYLWVPLATLGLWLAGLRTTYVQLYLQQNEVSLDLLFNLVLIAAGCAGLLIGWAEYNRLRFQGVDRRASQGDATLPEIADVLGMSIEDARAMQDARVSTVRLGPTVRRLTMPLPAVTAATAAPSARVGGQFDFLNGAAQPA